VYKSPAPLDVQIVEGASAISVLDRSWDELVERQQLPSPMLLAEWLKAVGEFQRAFVVLVSRRGTLVGGGAFRRLRVGPVDAATWLGGARLPGVLGARGDDQAAAAVVNGALDCTGAVLLPRVPAVGPTLAALGSTVQWRSARRVTPPGYLVKLPPPKLEKARAKSEYSIRRASRKGAEIEVKTRSHESELMPAFERLCDLYRGRWRGREDEGNRHSDIVVATSRYEVVLLGLARSGRVRIVEVFENDSLVASVLGFTAGRGALFHTTATKTAGALRGPGHIAMLAWVDEAMKMGCTAMYLGRGAGEPEGPKGRLGATELPLYDVVAARTRGRHLSLEVSAIVGHAIRGARARAGAFARGLGRSR
jgi:hypothetical protein